MRTILTNLDFQDAMIIKDIPDKVPAAEGIIELSLESRLKGIYGQQKAYILDGIYVERNKVLLPKDTSVYVRKESPHLELHLELSGYTSFSPKGKTADSVRIPHASGLLLYLPELEGQLNFAKNDTRESLEVEFSEEYFTSIFSGDLEMLGPFGKAILNQEPIFQSNQGVRLSPQILQIVVDIQTCKYHSLLKKIYLESKIRELLVVFISQNQKLEIEQTGKRWSKADIEKLYAARELVAKNIGSPYSIVELSKQVGLNDFKLKKGFKELFGTTIFGYINELRMAEAKLLLIDPAHSIADIAYRVGFKNPQHFTAAFKKQYGILPKDIRINR